MMRRTLGNMASYYTEQQSLDVKEGLARRVQEGWFVGHAPYGYKNIRKDGRGVVTVDPSLAANVRRMFHLFAYEPLTLDAVVNRLHAEGMAFRASTPRFPKSSVHNILTDRAYIGEIEFRGQWYPGKQEPLVDRSTWDRVQALLGGHVYHSHQMTYAGEFITCAHCGHPITGERKTKKTKTGERAYIYYRCGYYNVAGHTRTRVTEADLDRQVLAVFDRIRIEDADVREWFREVLRSQTRDAQQESLAQREELLRQQSLVVGQQDRLVNMRMDDQIDDAIFARKSTELRDRLAGVKLQLDVIDRSHDETAELATKVFELSQTLRAQWLSADYAAKRRILEIVFLNCRLDDVTLVPSIRKPFDLLAEGLLTETSRGDRI
jgi:site-specific DNA recombinase